MKGLLLVFSFSIVHPVDAASANRFSFDRAYAEQWVNRSTAEYGIPAAMVRAVIRVESGWNPGAYSSKGAIGIMQLMPGTARTLHLEHPDRIDQNIQGGTAYLALLFQRFHHDWRLTLAAYMQGQLGSKSKAFAIHRHLYLPT